MPRLRLHNARTIGSFFLLAFVAYGLGRHLSEAGSLPEKYLGYLLILVNSVMVSLIGVLLRKNLLGHNEQAANLYLFARLFEAIALASLVLDLVPGVSIPYETAYHLAMLVLGLGSIPMCLALHTSGLVPRWLALWGAIGYGIFAFGFLMELFGKAWSMYLLAPGGLWEISFGIWLLFRVHKNPRPH